MTRGKPREQYKRIVNVIPPDATTEQVRDIAGICWEAGRETITGSYDDAGVGDLDERIARLWGIPDEAHCLYAEWYETHYPDVKVEFVPLDTEPEELRFTYPSTHLPPVITSPYGPRGAIFHHGVDFRSSWAAWGTEILSALDGEVILAGIERGREYFGYQVQVLTRWCGDSVVCRYAHLVSAEDGGIYVEAGQQVERGDKLGRPDNTGTSWGDHLHFDVRVNGAYINPTDMIDYPDEDTASD